MKKEIENAVEEACKAKLAELSLEIYSVEYKREGKDWILRVYIDRKFCEDAAGIGYDKQAGMNTDARCQKAQGIKADSKCEKPIGIDECTAISEALSEYLDKNDIIDNNYYLEVSTPGIDRELKKDIDFIRFKGRSVEISLYKRIDGKKEYRGTLIEKNDEGIAVEVDGSTKVFSNNDVAKVNLAIEF